MIQESSNESRLISAINANNWDEIYHFAAKLNLNVLRTRANFFKDKVESDLFLKLVFELKKHTKQDKANRLRLRQWLESNENKFDNEYMYSFLRNITFEDRLSEIDIPISALEELITKFPDRWESYITLAVLCTDDRNKSLRFLRKAQEINPKKEIILLWSMALSADNLEQILEYGNKGYPINRNNLFLFFMAKNLDTSGKVNQAKEYYQKIVTDEPEGSYLREIVEKELQSSCFIATLVYKDKYAPEVETLRFIRDSYLRNTIGRLFIKMYYRHSPNIAESIYDMPMLIKFIKLLLNSLLSLFYRLRLLS